MDIIVAAMIVNALAEIAIADAWFLGSVFADARAHAEYMRDNGEMRITHLAGELLCCRFCLGYHITFWLSIMWIPLLPMWYLFLPIWFASRYLAWRLTPQQDENDGPTKNS